MRMMKWNRGLVALGMAAAGVVALASVASALVDPASVTTEQSGSVIIFPKVIWDGSRDTIITISNTANNMAFAHCFYVNAAVRGQWTETDFDVFLTKQQPTHWNVSAGRRTLDLTSSDPNTAGLLPGSVPPVPQGFKGELKCIQVDEGGAPTRSNSLKGEATLRSLNGDVSKYNAIALRGNMDAGADEGDANDLTLDWTVNHSGEYSSCPDTLLFDFFAYGADDPVISELGDCDSAEGGCPITTTLTLVPCSENLELQQQGTVTVTYIIKNEFEERRSGGFVVDCFLDLPLNKLNLTQTTDPNGSFTVGGLGTLTGYARITPNPGAGGVIGIAEEVRQSDNDVSGRATTAAFNLQVEGNRFDGATNGDDEPRNGATDHIIIPGE